MANLVQVIMRSSAKSRSEKCDQNPQKPVKDKTSVNLQA